jgi:hypothetical protein
MSVEEWLQEVHGEAIVECHTLLGAQCAGTAIYRSNVCKSSRGTEALVLPADRETVFANPMEFAKHHKKVDKLPAGWTMFSKP